MRQKCEAHEEQRKQRTAAWRPQPYEEGGHRGQGIMPLYAAELIMPVLMGSLLRVPIIRNIRYWCIGGLEIHRKTCIICA